MQDEAAPAAPLLSYAKRPQWHRRKRIRRFAIWLFVIASGAALWYWRVPLMDYAKFSYFQHKCLTYSMPKDQIIGFTGKPDEIAALTRQSSTYIVDKWGRESTFVRRADSTGEQYCRCGSVNLYQTMYADCFADFYDEKLPNLGPRFAGPPGQFGNTVGATVAFMHERQSAGGKKRLVIVYFGGNWGPGTGCVLAPVVYPVCASPKNCSPTTSPRLEIILGDYVPIPNAPGGSTWRSMTSAKFFAGQIDTSDASRFTIRYELDGAPGTIGGQLFDNDQVKLNVYDGPALLHDRIRIIDVDFWSFL
jgi:hypothetical protein